MSLDEKLLEEEIAVTLKNNIGLTFLVQGFRASI